MAGAGTATSALGFGGYQPSPAYGVTESWNGNAWTEVADLNTARNDLGGTPSSANNTSALAFGGTEDPPVTGATEEWAAGTTTKTVDAS